MRSSTSVGVLALLVGLSSAPRAFATACTEAAVRQALLAGGDVDVVCATRTTIALDVALTVPALPTTLEGHGKLVLAPKGGFPAFALPAAVVNVALRGVEISSGTALAVTGGSALSLERVFMHDISGTPAAAVRVDGAKLRLRGSTLVNDDGTARPLIAASGGTLDVGSSSLLGTGTTAVRLAADSKGVRERHGDRRDRDRRRRCGRQGRERAPERDARARQGALVSAELLPRRATTTAAQSLRRARPRPAPAS